MDWIKNLKKKVKEYFAGQKDWQNVHEKYAAPKTVKPIPVNEDIVRRDKVIKYIKEKEGDFKTPPSGPEEDILRRKRVMKYIDDEIKKSRRR
jgi:hypothetical protein